MEFIETCREGKKISLNGYMHVRKANKTNRIRWQCSNKDAYDCKGALTTSLQLTFNCYFPEDLTTTQTHYVYYVLDFALACRIY